MIQREKERDWYKRWWQFSNLPPFFNDFFSNL